MTLTVVPDHLASAPPHWAPARLDRLFTARRESPRPGDELVSAFIDGTVTLRSHRPEAIIKSSGMEVGYKRVVAGDLVISGMNAHLGGLGISDSTGRCSPVYLVGRPTRDIDGRFVSYLLRHLALSGYVKSLVNTIRFNSSDFSFSDLKKIALALPPLDEQRAIADYLDRETARIDALITARKRMMALLAERRASTVAKHVMPPTDPSPGWRLMRLRHVVRQIIDTEHKTTPFYDDGGFLVVRTNNVRAGRLLVGSESKFTDMAGYREWTVRGTPEAGDILFTREAPAGEACLMPPNMRVCIGQRMVLLKLDDAMITGRYALRALYGGIARSFIDELSQGSTVAHLNMRDISDIPLWVPSLEQQREIASQLDRATARLDRLGEAIEEQGRLLSEHRTALITAAVTGQIEVPVPV